MADEEPSETEKLAGGIRSLLRLVYYGAIIYAAAHAAWFLYLMVG